MPDVVVVGSGHNALVAACYLAREGLDVEVVERDTVLGGAVSSVERFPGYLVDRGSSLHVMIRHTGIVEELGLTDAGLTYLDCDPWGFYPVPDAPGGGIAFWTDLERTRESISQVCGSRDAAAYRDFVLDWASRNDRIFAAFQAPPTVSNLGRSLWGVGRSTGLPGVEIARQFMSPADALLDASFRDERLRTALSWLGAQAGPPAHEVATADLVGWNAMLHRRAPGRPVGGSGALTAALRRRLESYGGRVRLGDAVARIETRAGQVCGVRTQGGVRLRARAVLAGCHIATTLDLVAHALDGRLGAERSRLRVGNGLGMAIRLGTTALPDYPGAPPQVHHGMVLAAPDRFALRRAYGRYLAGETPEEPPVLVMASSSLDPTIAPPGRHNITVWGQWHPYRLAGDARWEDIGEQEGDKLVAALERVAPGFAATVEHRHIQTPLDLERELDLRHGNVMHLEMGLDAMFAWRPLSDLSGYRGPLDCLYVCGASTHPGGGVFGASGRSAARVMLADLRPGLRPAALREVSGRTRDALTAGAAAVMRARMPWPPRR
jgi:phytoene dehydrogenase-like protein